MVRYRPGIYDPPIGGGLDSTTPLSEGVLILRPPLSEGVSILRPTLPHPNSHLLVAPLLVVINHECPLDVSWERNLCGLEVGKLGKIAPTVRKIF